MELLDLHAHILPGVDDGAKDIEESLALLQMLKAQGVTTVVATPHFYGMQDNIEDFKARVEGAKAELFAAVKDKDLPQILVGSEVLYFAGMGTMEGVRNLTLNGSKYMLLEFDAINFDSSICKDITRIRDNWSITPIIAHIERYQRFKGYKNLINLVKSGVCKAQVNASSVVGNVFTKGAHKLIKKGIISYIASDTHSVDLRPPAIDKAYAVITETFGKHIANRFILNSQDLLERIK